MNAQPDAHPGPADLAAFGLGRLSAVDSDVVAGHLEHCEPCRRVVESVPADSLLALLRAVRSAAEDLPASGPPAEAPVNPIATLNTGSDSSVASGPNRTGPWAARPLSGVEIPPELVDHPRYRIIRMLGKGGMGAVYLAEHIVMRQPRALKVVAPEFVANPQAVQRFRQEIETAARLQHRNVVHAYDAEQSGQTHFLVMEYVHGVDLSTLVKKKGPLPVAHSCHFIRQAALGLQHARKHRMVHRDIKPHNLILAGKGLVKILDFGLAKIASEAGTEVGGQPVTPPLRHEQRVIYVTFSPSGARLVTASADKTARVWDAVTGQAVTPPLQHDGIALATFSPDGKGVVTTSNDTARLWDAESGKEMKRVSISQD